MTITEQMHSNSYKMSTPQVQIEDLETLIEKQEVQMEICEEN